MRSAILALSLALAACSSGELARARTSEAVSLSEARPVAVLFSLAGCRYCAIAERGMVGASRELHGAVEFRKVMVESEDLDELTGRYALQPSMPQARLLLSGGRWRTLPLTRDGPVVAQAIREALAGK